MSKVSIEGNASGTGTLTIAAPNTNSNFTLSLPTNTGTIITQNSTPAFASTIGVGGATAAASGAGITFPATQSASSDANTLDDYEEGTWTPTLNANLTAVAAYAKGRYVKIGPMVWVTYSFRVNTVSGANAVEFGSLPFANISGTADTSADTFLFVCWDGVTVGDRGVCGYLSGGSSTIQIFDLVNNGSPTALTNSDLAGNDFLWVSGWYRTTN
jgi:hypothetical protein